MPKFVRTCIECDSVFETGLDDIWLCNECQVKATDRRGVSSQRAEIDRLLAMPPARWKAAGAGEKMIELLKFLRLKPAAQLKEGRTRRFGAHRGKTQPAELPTCSQCGALALLEPCRACSPPTAGPDDLKHWHDTMRRTKTKKRRR